MNNRQAAIAAIRKGLADVAVGRVKPARQVSRALAKRLGIRIAH
jgi:hypothetical protein